jgi:hypothetical protein
MFRFATSHDSVVEAHLRTQAAMHELTVAIEEAFLAYEGLHVRLGAYERELSSVRAHLSAAGYHSNGALPSPDRTAAGPSTRADAQGMGERRSAPALTQPRRPGLAPL